MSNSRAPARISIAEAAEQVGLSTWTIRRRIADGTLTAYRVRGSRSIRLDAADVEALLEPIPMAGGGR